MDFADTRFSQKTIDQKKSQKSHDTVPLKVCPLVATVFACAQLGLFVIDNYT